MESRSTAADPAVSSALVQTPLSPEQSARLLEYIRGRRWFRGKARPVRELELLDAVPLSAAGRDLALFVVRVAYSSDDAAETYVLPLAWTPDRAAAGTALFPLRDGVVYDPSGSDWLSLELLALFLRERTPGKSGRIVARPSPALQTRAAPGHARFEPHVPSGEQSNTSVFFGEEFMLKLFRQLEVGENPDVELVEFLWAHGYHHVPEPLGDVYYERAGSRATLGIAQRFVPSEGSAWDVTLEILQRSLQLARTLDPEHALSSLPKGDLLDIAGQPPSEQLESFLGAYAPFATLLGERTAELHRALASDHGSLAFRPEPFDTEYQTELANAARERLRKAYQLLERQRASLPGELQASVASALDARQLLERTLDALSSVGIHAERIRRHGDYHLGQVLYGESDFTILDFEGEPAQALSERRRKGSALYDVCGMLRSFHYAATVALQNEPAEERASLARWSDAWYRWISAQFLCAYLVRARQGGHPVFLPAAPVELRALLQLHLIDKCSYELSYELNNRPAWVGVPLAGLSSLAESIRLSGLE
ncbi:MAG TPA: hypothetical protein VJR89_10175 [Polyangiales bacterium]|nr:hypothetical protein [Polyangiales bacterium]